MSNHPNFGRRQPARWLTDPGLGRSNLPAGVLGRGRANWRHPAPAPTDTRAVMLGRLRSWLKDRREAAADRARAIAAIDAELAEDGA